MTDPARTDPRVFYDEYGEREWERLDRDFHHRLEWEATVDRLDADLPEPDEHSELPSVLDVGGGAGRYSIWLAERGYRVTMVEVSETQRELARERLSERGLDDQVTVHEGDVRDLDFEERTFDATLCLGGPLSHVLDAAERSTAVRELERVTKPGGPVFVSVMGLIGMALITTQYAGRNDGRDPLTMLPELLRTQEFTGELASEHDVPPFMADCHFFRREEFVDLLSTAGLEVVSVNALEGVAACRRSHFDALDADGRDVVRTVNDELRTDPTVVDVSPHMLAVCLA